MEAVATMCSKYGSAIRPALFSFLDPRDPVVREFMLRRLCGGFFRQAIALDSNVLEELGRSITALKPTRVFVDTNFLFSLLGLHDNPGNDTARDLKQLLDSLSGPMAIQLYVLPITVDEATRTLREVSAGLRGIRATQSMASVANRLVSAGLASAYFTAAGKDRSGTLTPESFFGPYEQNLPAVLEERGIRVLSTDLESLRRDQQVIDDVHDLIDFQKQRRRQGPKSYEANLHDSVLWNYIKRNRPPSIDSPADATLWICTLDYGLIAFDRRKQHGRRKMPICLLPSALIQLIQFWAPRSEALDAALVGAMREPLLFLDFDRESERVTSTILAALSRFENVGDMSPELMYKILTNDALRERIGADQERSSSQDVEYIREALIDETESIKRERDRLLSERETLTAQSNAQVGEKDEELALLTKRLGDAERTKADLQRDIEELKVEFREHDRQQDAEYDRLKEEHEALETDVRSERTAREKAVAKRQDRARLLVLAVSSLLLIFAIAIGAAIGISREVKYAWVAWVLALFAGLCAWLVLVEQVVARSRSFSNARGHRSIRWLRDRFGRILIALIVSVLGACLYGTLGHTSSRAPSHTTETTKPKL